MSVPLENDGSMGCIKYLQSLTKEQRLEIYRGVETPIRVDVEWSYPDEKGDEDEELERKSRCVTVTFTSPFGCTYIGGTIEEVRCYPGDLYLDGSNFSLQKYSTLDEIEGTSDVTFYRLESWSKEIHPNKSDPLGMFDMDRKTAELFLISLQKHLKETKFGDVDLSNFFGQVVLVE